MDVLKNFKWYVLTSKPRAEKRAYQNLINQGFDVFLPEISKVKSRQGIKSVSLEPLFPNYLFINLNQEQDNFNTICYTRGVGAFVRFGLTYAIISNSLINQMKIDFTSNDKVKTLDELTKFTAGETLEISDGPFKGLQAIYKKKDSLERSVLLINLLGQQNEVSISNLQVNKT